MHSTVSDNDHDYEQIKIIREKLVYERIRLSKSNGDILNGLRRELNQLKSKSTGKSDEKFYGHISTISFSYLDESKGSYLADSRPSGTEKVRFETRPTESSKDHDDWTTRTNTTSDERSSTSRTVPVIGPARFRSQQANESSWNTLRKKRTTKIRLKDALDILHTYHSRCKIHVDSKTRRENIERHSTRHVAARIDRVNMFFLFYSIVFVI
jgi:hypothetical protein